MAQRVSEDDLVQADLVIMEVLQGVRGGPRIFASTRRQLLRFETFAIGGMPLVLASAANYRLLRSRGITVRKSIDCLIATFCINAGIELLHNDRDFDPFEQHLGLRVAR